MAAEVFLAQCRTCDWTDTTNTDGGPDEARVAVQALMLRHREHFDRCHYQMPRITSSMRLDLAAATKEDDRG